MASHCHDCARFLVKRFHSVHANVKTVALCIRGAVTLSKPPTPLADRDFVDIYFFRTTCSSAINSCFFNKALLK